MKIKATTPAAYKLLHDGCIALAGVEGNGMRIDVKCLKKTIKKTTKKIKRVEEELMSDTIFKTWNKRFHTKTNLGADKQLATILFDVMKFPSPGETKGSTEKKKQYKSDEAALKSTGLKFVELYIHWKQLNKIRGTYLNGILKHEQDGLIHAVNNLHVAKTYRSSIDSPSLQNIPIRDPAMAAIIRPCFIPRKGRVLVEIDISGAEVCVAACYHKDPRMIEYITDPTKDMHRDMAAQIYKLKPKQITKAARHAGKNQFVFPQFYGDWYINNARALWKSSADLTYLKNGKELPLRKHLNRVGLKKLGALDPKEDPKKGTFESHVKSVEKDFWGNRFEVYGDWKNKWCDKFQRRGSMHTLTGFTISGDLSRNEIINYPIQGSAFHCLLWALIELQTYLEKQRWMQSKIVLQIHDSIIADVPIEELDEYIETAVRFMTDALMQEWKWLIVPLEVEPEVTPVDGNWFQKQIYERKVV